ncbi:MAG: thioredoxin family protein [Pseudomonadota bacterium]
MVADLKGKMGPEDELFIYTTGHGDKGGADGKGATLCMGSACHDLAGLLDGIPSSRRRVVMDQCYSGNWNRVFMDDPKTLFISAGSKNETVCCGEMAPRLWAPASEVPDLNGDHAISWDERYAYAAAGVRLSEPQFLVSPGYRQEGAAPFENRVVEVATPGELKGQTKRLHPGQYAIITFSADWCGPCKVYAPDFDRMAREGGGQHLFLRTENEELAKAWGVQSFPTVVIIDASGQRRVVDERYKIEWELAGFELTAEERFLKKITDAEKITDTSALPFVFESIAKDLVEAGLKEKAIPVFERLIAAAEKITDGEDCPFAFQLIAVNLAKAGLQEKAVPLFERIIAAVEKITDAFPRSLGFQLIAESLAKAGLQEKAVPLFERSIAATEEIKDPHHRSFVSQLIAVGLAKAGLKDRVALPRN